ncbi:hypothetical protein J6590_016506 [Homalodisca vitripennis]|nr:hypothetical protein J6590_016506 [Homalodisca vitripennis]
MSVRPTSAHEHHGLWRSTHCGCMCVTRPRAPPREAPRTTSDSLHFGFLPDNMWLLFQRANSWARTHTGFYQKILPGLGLDPTTTRLFEGTESTNEITQSNNYVINGITVEGKRCDGGAVAVHDGTRLN